MTRSSRGCDTRTGTGSRRGYGFPGERGSHRGRITSGSKDVVQRVLGPRHQPTGLASATETRSNVSGPIKSTWQWHEPTSLRRWRPGGFWGGSMTGWPSGVLRPPQDEGLEDGGGPTQGDTTALLAFGMRRRRSLPPSPRLAWMLLVLVAAAWQTLRACSRQDS